MEAVFFERKLRILIPGNLSLSLSVILVLIFLGLNLLGAADNDGSLL